MRMNHTMALAVLTVPVLFSPVCKSATAEQTASIGQSRDPTKVRWSLYSQSREEKAGKKIAKQIEKPGNLLQDHVVVDYVNRVAHKVLTASGSDRSVNVKVLMMPAFNAFSIPGGTIYLTAGLLKGLDSEDELASVLGHEIAHVAARHWANHQSKHVLLRTSSYAIAAFVPLGLGNVVDIGYDRTQPHLLDAFSRQEEQEADALGLKYVYRAGYDPAAFISFLQKASKIEENDPEKSQKDMKDHPQTASRIAKAQQEIMAVPLPRAQTPEAALEFASIQERLPDFALGTQSTRLTFSTHRDTPPSIVNPTEIKNFMQDETPPVLKWTNPSKADDDGN